MRPFLAWAAALLGVLVVQSSVLPLFVPDPWRPDLTRALVLWLALTGVPRRGPFLALGGGAAVDWISGAPIGFTAFTRLVLYGLCRPFRGVFFDHHPLLLVPFAAAGALADGTTVARAWEQGLDPTSHLTNNDAYPFFEALGDLIITGPTNTNVNDLTFVFAF